MMAEVDPFARQSGESFVDYLARIKQLRGGMLLGQYTPTVDDVVAEEITDKPLGMLVQNVPQDNGNGDEERLTPAEQEARRQASLERAVGVLTGQARPVAELAGALGPVGMMVGAGIDAMEQSKLESALEKQGFSKAAIDQLVENPQVLESQLKQGNLGFSSTGYQQSFVDKGPSVLGLLGGFLGGDDNGPAVGSAPGATSVPLITNMANMPASAFNYGITAPATQGLFTTNLATNPTLLPAGVGTVLAPGYEEPVVVAPAPVVTDYEMDAYTGGGDDGGGYSAGGGYGESPTGGDVGYGTPF